MLAHSGHVMTLSNSIIGVGILAMPFCFQKCGIILSILLLIVSNLATRVCCHYLIKCSLLTRRRSIEFLGFHAFGASGKLLVELCIIGFLLGSCITSFVVVGDLGPQIINKMFALKDGHAHLRTIIMIAVTVFCILPLGMLKNVDSLSTVCTASIGFYVCLVIKIVLESEAHIVLNDWPDHVAYWQPGGILQCLPIFSMALSCQMQIFEVFSSVNNQSVEQLNSIVKNSTRICTLVYIAVGFFGYVAFCKQDFSGNILMNLSPSFGSDVIKIGFILSVAFSFPLVIFPCRASLYSLIYRKGHADVTGYIPEARFKAITIFIITFSLCIGLMIPSVELIIGLVGSTIGVAICIMFPAACYRKIVKKDSTERMLAQVILVSGFCLMILGTYANLGAIDEKSSGPHLDQPNMSQHLLSSIEQIPIAQKPSEEIEKILSVPEQMLKLQRGNISKSSNANADVSKSASTLVSEENASPVPPPLAEHKQLDAELPPKIELIQDNIQSKTELKKPPPLPKQETAEVPAVDETKSNDKQEPLVNKSAPLAASLAKEEDRSKAAILAKDVQSQTIDNDAIKKDDEIAAEESKNDKAPKAAEEELRKKTDELEKAKKLFERTVDELKELAKINIEKQNLVGEKLEQVVEKVDQIQRKVNGNEPQQELKAVAQEVEEIQKKVMDKKQQQELNEVVEKVEQIERDVMGENLSQGKTLNVKKEPQNESIHADGVKSIPQQVVKTLTEKEEKLAQPPKDEQPIITKEEKNISAAPVETAAGGPKKSLLYTMLVNSVRKVSQEPHNVYEPLSYKAGEILENMGNPKKNGQPLPLPLSMLIDAAQVVENEGDKVDAVESKKTKTETEAIQNAPSELKHEKDEAIVKNNELVVDVETKNIKNAPNELKSDTVKAIDENNKLAMENVKNVVNDSGKENVEAIRRDILQVDTENQAQRMKRSNSLAHDEDIYPKEIKDPIEEVKAASNLVDAVAMKMQGHGRDLKSLPLEDEKHDDIL